MLLGQSACCGCKHDSGATWRRYRRERVDVEIDENQAAIDTPEGQGRAQRKVVKAWMYLLRDQSGLTGDEVEVAPLGDWRRCYVDE